MQTLACSEQFQQRAITNDLVLGDLHPKEAKKRSREEHPSRKMLINEIIFFDYPQNRKHEVEIKASELERSHIAVFLYHRQ